MKCFKECAKIRKILLPYAGIYSTSDRTFPFVIGDKINYLLVLKYNGIQLYKLLK